MKNYSSFESHILFVDGGVREDFNFGQHKKETHHSSRLMLLVQEERRDYRSLILHCEVVGKLHVSIFRLFGVEWVIPRRVIELLAS